jgi:transaldolase/glucose-6-phosphate isomerase
MTKIHELTQHGQSIWFDYIRRAFLTSGELQEWMDQGVRGVTSNPSIFEKAIAGSADYDADLHPLIEAGKSVEEIYEALALDDIRLAADILRPVYDESEGADGYVSLEVSPRLAHDLDGTLADARRLFTLLARPNVMIKVPATPAGILAIETLISEEINLNVTLIFSLAQYEAVAEAYLAGLEKRATRGEDLSHIASVASFFISRLEGPVDHALAELGRSDIQGKTAVANAKLAYARFRELFSGERWQKLVNLGARVQRPLWASTGTKNPQYSDTLYVDELIGPHTVNTVPPETLNAFLDHGTVAATIQGEGETARAQFAALNRLGIDVENLAQSLLEDGVAAFAKSFDTLLASVAKKREAIQANEQRLSANLGNYQNLVNTALQEIKANHLLQRIWQKDHTVWKPDPIEIHNRLGWLHTPEQMLSKLGEINKFVAGVRAEGYTDVLLLGMGGSSLAPEVFRKTFGVREGFLDLTILDSTDPDAVAAHAARLDFRKTLFIVATKSGGTAETFSFFKYFYNQLSKDLGRDEIGKHFVAITDPGSQLAELAQNFSFRATFLNDPNIGGRYSALSYFGIVPAALIGVDLEKLLNRALTTACNCDSCNCPVEGDNLGGQLGVILGELAKAGRDKLTFVTSPAIASFGDWVEQLIAESTGKEGKGILPVVTEPVGTPDVYREDRLFVHLRLKGDDSYAAALRVLEATGHPVVRLHLDDLDDLGGQFFVWEMATAVAGSRLGINPFDQPNVEAAKILARQMIAAYQESGTLPQSETAPLTQESLASFLSAAQPGDYVALHAYVQPTPQTTKLLTALATQLRDRYGLATTVGYGPRFLHSTGQLHKGDGGHGFFIQFTSEATQDVPIPDEVGKEEAHLSFGTLKLAQAVGDGQALREAKRRVIRFHLGTEVTQGLLNLGMSVNES